MHWKRRQPKWPYMVALACLFALTLVAPRSWQRLREAPQVDAASRESQSQSHAVNDATRRETAAPVLVLPPVAEPILAEPTLAEPVVEADDYIVVDDPPAAPAPPIETVLPTPEVEENPSEAASAATDGFQLRPSGRSVLVRNAAAPPTPAFPAFRVESLIEIRDALVAIVEQARQRQEQTQQAEQLAPPHNPLRVMVANEHDRLAMVPELAEPPAPGYPPALLHRPDALLTQLEALKSSASAGPWADAVFARVERLTLPSDSDEPSVQPVVAELCVLAERGLNDAMLLPDPADQSAWMRSACALERRLAIWELLVDPRYANEAADAATTQQDHPQLSATLAEVAALTADAEQGPAWRTYLRFDELAGLTSVGGANYAERRRAAARDVLVRMVDPWLTLPQREFLAQPPLEALARELRPWASGPVSLDTLAAIVERFESNPSQREADAIAELRLRMKWSADSQLVNLGEQINHNYRNANLRVAFSSMLINRMIPPQQPVDAAVRRQVAGATVRGRSQTSTELHVRLLPDPAVWRFGLEASGDVKSQTVSDTWPAQVRNVSTLKYEVRKLILINRYGLHRYPSEADADGRTQLVGVDSHFKYIPIVGGLVENAAREQHRQNSSKAVAEVKQKAIREACERMDAEGDARLQKFSEKFEANVLEPLSRFALAAEPLDMNTTEERATMRLRMAGEHQLAAYTPRPSAPSDSLASVQLHESALNNALRGLQFNGRRLTVGELHATLSEKIRRRAEAPPADLPQRAKVEFAKHDAVRIACHDDQIELILNIVELRHGRDSIRNVGVHAFFRPVVDGIELKLVREGSLQFSGAHLRTGPRLVLHGVFGKLLPKDQEAPLLAARLGDDPRFAGLMVTQLVIDDGWLAISLGPATPDRTAWRTRPAEVK